MVCGADVDNKTVMQCQAEVLEDAGYVYKPHHLQIPRGPKMAVPH